MSYQELRARAVSRDADAEKRLDFFYWMEEYDRADWNGEYFDIDNGLRMYPVYNITEDDGEIVDIELIDSEIR